MADKWTLFKEFWRFGDSDSPITDPSAAEDSLVEDAISRYHEVSKEITDMLAALSASRTEVDDLLRKLKEAVTLAYTFSLDGNVEEVRKTLEKVVGL